MNFLKKILKITLINIFFLIIGLLIIEIFFGKWFYKSNYGNLLIPQYSSSIINKPHYDSDKKYIYSRDKNGFRANNYDLEEIDILIMGGSTTEERFIDDNHIWTKVFERTVSKKINYKVLNAGIGGQTSFGHSNMFNLWFSRFDNLKPKYILVYLGINDSIKVNENFSKNILIINNNDYSKIKSDKLRFNSYKRKFFQYIKNNSALHLLYLIIRSSYISYKYKINNPNIKVFENFLLSDLYNHNTKEDLIEKKEHVIHDFSPLMDNYLPLYEKNLMTIIEYSKNLYAEPIFITNILTSGADARPYSRALSRYLEVINDKTISTCKKFNIQCFDIRNKIKLDVNEDFYDPLHTTPKGSAKIGKLIAEFFLDYVEK